MTRWLFRLFIAILTFFRQYFSESEKELFEMVKFMFSKKATKNDEIFTVDLTLHSVLGGI